MSQLDLAGMSPAERRELLVRLMMEKEQRQPREEPASFAQERLWFLDRLRPGSPIYNIPAAMRLFEAVTPPLLEQALREMARRHETLRTTFSVRDGRPVQVIAPGTDLRLDVADLSAMEPVEREAEATRIVSEEASKPFDLERGPLVRAKVVLMGPADHMLLVTMHHIISDGWSMGVFFRELGDVYAALLAGLPSPLKPMQVQYAHYARKQREELAGGRLDALLRYWSDRLKGAPTLLELPSDRPRPPVQSSRGGVRSFRLGAQATAAVRALCRAETATPFMVLLAAFAAVLNRWTGQDDLVLGSPIAGRTSLELEGLVGFFVNTLVLRTDLSGDPSFRALVRRVRESTLGAFAHQELPFERLVEELQPERSMAYNPLVQVVFTFQNTPDATAAAREAAAEAAAAQGGEAPPMPMPSHGTAKFDVVLGMHDMGEMFGAHLEYNADLFDAASMARLAAHFTTLLAAAVEQPDRPVSALPLMPSAERRAVAAWGRAPRERDPSALVHRLIAAQAAKTPDSVAVVSDDETLTYAELDARANRLARHLRSLGVGPEVCVGICLERTAELPVAVLAVLKAGGAYVPLDPAYPVDRLDFMVRDAAAPVVVTRAEFAGRVGDGAKLVRLDTDAAAIAAQDSGDVDGGAGPNNLAYVIFTSGSTGRPKGTMVEHRGFANLILWWIDTTPVDETSRVLLMIPIGFDASIKNFIAPLLVGAQVVVTTTDPGDADGLVKVIRERGVTVLTCTPSLIHPVIDAAAADGYESLATMRRLCTGGEPVVTSRLRPWLGRPDAQCRAINVYGPTECTDLCATHIATADDVMSLDVLPVGRPVHNARLYVVDPTGMPQPPGVPGELWVAGTGVSRGYLNRPALTAQKFGPAPTLGEERVYRTGDRVRWRPDGVLEFMGRMDEQVKVRGVRVEPGEVESALLEHAAVREAVVVPRPAPDGAKVLVAYVVAADGAGDDVRDELRAFLRGRLPEPMVPTAWVMMDAFPISPNGKVDRRALPEPDAGREEQYVAPRTPLEEALASIWAEVLRVEQVGAMDNFFDLGGHSLLATQVVSRVRDMLQEELPLGDLFRAPTVAELADAMANGSAEERARLEQVAEVALMLAGMSDDDVAAALRQ